MKLLSRFSGFIHQEGAEPNLFLSLKALESLNHLERLNLEQTHVRDATLKPLSSFQELRDLSLRSTSLTDVSLHYLSSFPKLTNLSFHDAMLSNSGVNLFNPSTTLKKMDMCGCWLLTADAILSFCKKIYSNWSKAWTCTYLAIKPKWLYQSISITIHFQLFWNRSKVEV